MKFNIKTESFGTNFNECLAFFSPKFIKYFDKSSQMNVDGTFRFEPNFRRKYRNPYQLLIFSGDICGKVKILN